MKDEIRIVIDCDVLNRYYEYYFNLHPRAKKVPIKHPYHESINQWMILQRQAMNTLKQKWKDFIKWLVNDLGYNDLNISSCCVSHKIYYQTRRRHDVDNTVPKFILDGLVEGHMLIDDSSENIRELTLSCGVDKDNPRTEILISINTDEEKETNDKHDG